MKIRIINPTFRGDRNKKALANYKSYASPNTDLSIVALENGPESIESYFDVGLAIPEALKQARIAEKEGIEAIVLDCMVDPGLFALREVVSIPVVGAAQASMHLAAILADRFSIITILERLRPIFNSLWKLYEMTEIGASIRTVEIPVSELRDHEEELIDSLIAQSVLAVNEDDAHAIIFGCTGMGGLTESVKRGLEQNNIFGIPVLDPTGVAIKLAEGLVSLQLSHSKKSFYPKPNRKVLGFEI
jgi:allantoin racemase